MAGSRETHQESIRLYVETSGDKELGDLAAQLTKLGQGADASAAQAEALVAELDKLANVGNNIRNFTTLKGEIADTGDKLGKAKAAAAALKTEFDAAAAPTQKLAAAMSKADASVDKLTKQQNRQQVELDRTSSALRNAGVDTTNLAAAYADLQGELGSLGARATIASNAMERTGKESKKAADGIGLIERASKGAGASLASIGARLTAVAAASTAALAAMAAAGTAALFTGAIRSATTLEDALTQVRAVTGATAAEMDALKTAAEAGGASTRFSTLEAAQGLGELARATGDATSAIAALPPTLDLAQASGIEVAAAATLMTTSLSQFSLGAEQATRVADVMAKEVNSTNDTMEKLGNALSYAAPLAQQLGFDIEDTAAAIGVMANEGFKGERAGTALRNVFSAMLDPASDFSQALRDIGIESSDFATIMQQLAAKGDLGREAIMQLDAEARPAILALVKGGGTALGELEAKLRSAGGEAARTAAIMGDTTKSAAEKLTGEIDRIQRSLVDPILEPLTEELRTLAAELETFATSPEFEEIKGALKTLFVESAAAARDLIESIDFKSVAENIRAFATDSDGSLTSFKESVGEVADAVKILGDTVSIVFNGVQALVFAVAAVTTRVVAGVAKAIDQLTKPAQKVLEFLGILDGGTSALDEFAGGVGAASDDFGRRMVENAMEAGAAIKGFGDGVGDASEKAGKGLSEAGAATKKLTDASKEVAGAAGEAKVALEGQAKGAITSAEATSTAADRMAVDADRLKKAFADMGIQSQQELGRAAASAKRNFELIRQAVGSGGASAEDARRAFAGYATAARAAVADSDASAQQRVDAELQVTAAVLGVTDALNRMGDAGKKGGQDVAQGAQGAVIAFSGVGQAATAAADGVEKAGDETEKAGENMRVGGKEGKSFALSLYEVSEKANEAYSAITRLQTGIGDSDGRFVRGMNDLTARIKNQGEAVAKQVKELQAANAEFDELAGRRKELAQQYDLLGGGELEKLLQAEQQLEANRKRAAEQRQREAEQLAQASAPAATSVAKPAEVAAVQIAQRETAAVVAGVLASTQQAAAALASAANSVRTASAGEIVVRLIIESKGANELTLNPTNTRQIAEAVIGEIRRQKGMST